MQGDSSSLLDFHRVNAELNDVDLLQIMGNH